jgi:thiol-disulfide isomerase/thioredoxin
VPGQDLQRIGAALAVDRDHDHGLAILEEVDLRGARVVRLIDRRDAIFRRASRLELLEWNEPLREVRIPLRRVGRRRRGLAESDQRPLLLELFVELLERLVDLLVARRLVRSPTAARDDEGDDDRREDSERRSRAHLHFPFDAIVLAADSDRKPVVINVWGSWCPGCIAEAEDLGRFAADHPEVQVAGVDLQDSGEAAKDFYERWRWTHPSVFDPDGEISFALGLQGTPSTFFLDRQHRIVSRIVGETD